VIDTATGSVIGDTVTQFSPEDVAVSPDGKYVFATVGREVFSVIDAETDTVVATIIQADPNRVDVSPDGTHVYVTNNDNTVFVITLG
jgi:DNA-binding beta-propeller fold protein YncE